jgi:hypothetical protein
MIDRPSVATQDYWDLHYTMICIGYEVPKMLVMPLSSNEDSEPSSLVAAAPARRAPRAAVHARKRSSSAAATAAKTGALSSAVAAAPAARTAGRSASALFRGKLQQPRQKTAAPATR